MTLDSSLRRVHRHRAILDDPGLLVGALAYLASRTRPAGGHLLWDGPVDDMRVPVGRFGGGIYIDPRTLVWALAGRALDDAETILPDCGERLCVDPEHLVALLWTATGT